jgi:dihydrodipicolinate synthase/N-acetylneuraminate lyase
MNEQVLFGKDEVMNAALINGITGFVGSTYNYAGALHHYHYRLTILMFLTGIGCQ